MSQGPSDELYDALPEWQKQPRPHVTGDMLSDVSFHYNSIISKTRDILNMT